jgi:hypothetical protein
VEIIDGRDIGMIELGEGQRLAAEERLSGSQRLPALFCRPVPGARPISPLFQQTGDRDGPEFRQNQPPHLQDFLPQRARLNVGTDLVLENALGQLNRPLEDMD